MSDFPTLTPASRTFSPGDYPSTTFGAISGTENRVRHSNVVVGSTFKLEFTALTEAEMLSILTHYEETTGSYGAFYLSAEVLAGVSVTSDYTLSGFAWSYLEPPLVVDYPCGGHDVTVTLGTATAPVTDPSPRLFTVSISLTAGTAAAANGIAKTISFTISPGTASQIINVPSTIATILIGFPVPTGAS
ncbi:MAG: hypothetical protein WCF98_08890 [Synechococcus sp. ELA057]|jgi:hypothetical protein